MIHTEDYCVVDGGCLANGQADAYAYGSYKIYLDGQEVEHVDRLPFPEAKTNNQAEYQAMILLLLHLVANPEYAGRKWVIRTDSTLVRKQLEGKWRVLGDNLKHLHQQAHSLLSQLDARLEYLNEKKVKEILGH
jgi:ribonuclease HI